MSLQILNRIMALIILIWAETLKIIQNVLKWCRDIDQILKKRKKKKLNENDY